VGARREEISKAVARGKVPIPRAMELAAIHFARDRGKGAFDKKQTPHSGLTASR
jgi:hypothetical protein